MYSYITDCCIAMEIDLIRSCQALRVCGSNYWKPRYSLACFFVLGRDRHHVHLHVTMVRELWAVYCKYSPPQGKRFLRCEKGNAAAVLCCSGTARRAVELRGSSVRSRGCDVRPRHK